MKKLSAVALLALALLVAVPSHAQTQVTESSTSMTGPVYSQVDATAHYADGTFVRIMYRGPNQVEIFAKAYGETVETIAFFTASMHVSNQQIGQTYLWSVYVDPFSFTTAAGNTITVTEAMWTVSMYSRSGRGGGNVYKFLGGTEDITIDYLN